MSRNIKIKKEVKQICELLERDDVPLTNNDPKSENAGEFVENCEIFSEKVEHLEEVEEDSEYVSSDASTDEDEVYTEATEITILEQLANWAVEFNVPNVAVNRLLRLLSSHIKGLPSDVRTLKSTPKKAPVERMGDGEYVYYGIANGLCDLLRKERLVGMDLKININVDGLPLAKSSNLQLWPILINVQGTEDVLVAGAYYGDSKPLDCNLYMQQFVEEFIELMEIGLKFNNSIYSVSCRSFICDAPARSYILGIKGHTGYFSCPKCTIKGSYLNRRMIFETNNCDSRNDKDFRLRHDPNHHIIKETLCLEKLPVDIVKTFAFDYMHIVCIGVVKSLIKAWVKQKKQPFSLKNSQLQLIDAKLFSLNRQLPKEFSRGTRSLHEIDRFKATELRTFLLYTGLYVLNDVLDKERYEHFLMLSLAIRILLHESDCLEYNECAKRLINEFVKKIPRLYNETFLTFNTHCLTHLADEALNFGSIETISAFKFENHLGKLKRKCKKNNNVVAQIFNRLIEESINFAQQYEMPQRIKEDGEAEYIKTNSIFLSNKKPNNVYCVGNEIFLITKIIKKLGIVWILSRQVKNLCPFFHEPLTSSLFHIQSCCKLTLSQKEYKHLITDVSQKIIMLENMDNNNIIFIPLIHKDT
ncbi:uncharacterized protein LOC142224563 [Haematobia irritans]|uniref:uncharacterized protein LOC142224563 n=1 Tax=Haematobia irritans TaxID=7368 RepID=UPI003F503624